ncbi:rod-binding protein [Treponema sp.]|uniref:rod-binding protein n=1 Tax=Treponema sp. TaxID=166 RepID=UPI0025CC0FDF|nr:rod-binding protein [Treponema sp.]MCR5218002.1 rod-binding protein [Treponema sp.]
MAVNGISGTGITGTLGNSSYILNSVRDSAEHENFKALVESAKKNLASSSTTFISSSQIARNHKLNGDYTQGFYGTFTSEKDKDASPQGFAANATSSSGKKITIDKTSDLYAQSMEMENYMVKMMLSSMRNTIKHTSLSGSDNDYARKMYDDMMYDNLAESLTKNSGFGIADQIYIELSGQR